MKIFKLPTFILNCLVSATILLISSDILANNKIKTIPLDKSIRISQSDKLDFGNGRKVSFIPIETEEYFLPEQMRFAGISENTLFVYNRNYIVSIDMVTGKINAKIDRKGNGPEEYVSILSAAIDSDENVIVVYDANKDRILKYDYKGNFIETMQLDVKGTVGIMPDGKYIVCYKPYSSKKNLYGIYDSEGKLIRESKRIRREKDSRILTYNMSQNFNENCFIRQAYQDTVVCIRSYDDYPMLHINVGKYHVPDSQRKVLSILDKYIDINDLNIAGDYLFLGYYYNDRLYRDVWNIEKSELMSRTIVKNQNSRFGFPVTVNGSTLYSWCDFTYGNSVFCFLPYWESVKLFPDRAEDDNPVIIKIDL